MNGTCIPLNVDSSTMGLDSDDEITVTVSNLSLHANKQYQNATLETISKTNTGYLVSYSTYRGDSWIRSGIRTFAKSTYSGIPDSFNGDTDMITFDDEHKKQFAMYTIQGNSTYLIIDDINQANYSTSETNKTYSTLGLVKYKNVRANFDTTMDGAEVYHGFHFMNNLPDDTTTTNLTSYTSTQPAYILGKQYESYEFIKGALNFTVENNGYITAIVGSGYASAGSGNSLFDLYKADRDENKKITSLTRINQVYTDSNGNVAFNSKPSDEYSLNIDIKTLASTSNKLEKDAAYYFEIPVTAGDYVIGAAKSSGTHNAYFMYLDIGANGSDSSEDTASPTEIDFVYYDSTTKKLVKITSEKDSDGNYIYKNSKVVFQIASTASGIFAFNRTASASVLYYFDTGNTVTVIGTGNTDNKINKDDVPSN